MMERMIAIKLNRTMFVLVVCAIFLVSVVFAENAQAASCACFCQTENGAERVQQKDIPFEQCEPACAAKGQKVAVCASGASQYPANSLSCFSLEQCTRAVDEYCDNNVEKDEQVTCKRQISESFETSIQPTECPKGYHYCYAPKGFASITLNTPINDTGEIKELEQYIQVGYKWMIGAGVIFAIVLTMIGGLQYALGGASSGQISAGKKRIQSAVVGLVLLLSAILIVETINPGLSSISVPRLPLLKTVALAGGGRSCEKLVDEDKFTIGWNAKGSSADVYTLYKGNNSPQCGTTGVVLKGPGGEAVPDGITCGFQQCPGSNLSGANQQRCVGAGVSASCLTCGDIYDGSSKLEGTGIIPSSTTCGQFTKGVTAGSADRPDSIERCVWTKDGNFGEGVGAAKFLTNGACAYMAINCAYIRQYGLCSLYAGSSVSNLGTDANDASLLFADTDPDEIAGCVGSCSNFSYRTVCEEDPCGIGCKWVPENSGPYKCDLD
jgi:hypothetical protein